MKTEIEIEQEEENEEFGMGDVNKAPKFKALKVEETEIGNVIKID